MNLKISQHVINIKIINKILYICSHHIFRVRCVFYPFSTSHFRPAHFRGLDLPLQICCSLPHSLLRPQGSLLSKAEDKGTVGWTRCVLPCGG